MALRFDRDQFVILDHMARGHEIPVSDVERGAVREVSVLSTSRDPGHADLVALKEHVE